MEQVLSWWVASSDFVTWVVTEKALAVFVCSLHIQSYQIGILLLWNQKSQ
jgi:hypothetical protein